MIQTLIFLFNIILLKLVHYQITVYKENPNHKGFINKINQTNETILFGSTEMIFDFNMQYF